MPTHKSEDYKITAVEYYLNTNKTQDEICNIFKCSVRSLMRWVKRYQNEDSVIRHNREAISYKVSKEHIKFIVDEIKKNKTITMETLLDKLKEKFTNLELSRRHLSDIVKDNNISLKLTHLRHEPITRFGKEINIKDKLVKNITRAIENIPKITYKNLLNGSYKRDNDYVAKTLHKPKKVLKQYKE